jgi:hypothetical protein
MSCGYCSWLGVGFFILDLILLEQTITLLCNRINRNKINKN